LSHGRRMRNAHQVKRQKDKGKSKYNRKIKKTAN